MIKAVKCDKPSFRTVNLKPGLNVALAERTKESTKRDSRNGLGKTTLIEIIHFCLGATATKGEGLCREPLIGWTFSLDIIILGKPYAIHRNTEKSNRVIIEGDCDKWPIKPSTDIDTGERYFLIRDWNAVLGWLMFGLPDETYKDKYTPTFRSLISYFIRKGRDAFSTPFEHARKQREWDKQVNNAFLLGLAWEHAQRWQILKDQEKTLSQLKGAAEAGLFPDLLGTVGELESDKIMLEEQASRREEQLRTFKVHPQYREIEENVNSLTVSVHNLSNENVSDLRLSKFYENSLREEKPADQRMLKSLYEETGIMLPKLAVKRLEEVQEFHQRIVSNRKDFLRSEIDRLNNNIKQREEEIRNLTEKRASLLSILRTHGALEEYTKLQKRHTEAISKLENVKTRIENLKKFKKGKSALRIDLERLLLEAQADYEERKAIRGQAISMFNANSEALYEASGKLIVDVGPKGFKYQVEIERSESQGIGHMKVFCYDLMLAQLWSQKDNSPGFLIHDSTLFDGVDERQVAGSIQLAAKTAEQYNFQYICCLNSDFVPWHEFSKEFNLRDYVCIELTDASPDMSLLGIRF